MDSDRNAEIGAPRLCARYDSRPEEKAKEPSGRAESARRKRKCGDEYDGVAASKGLVYRLKFVGDTHSVGALALQVIPCSIESGHLPALLEVH